MDATDSTCWTLIRGAATGRLEARDVFARRYEPVIRAYLSARWRSEALRSSLPDATQEVFLACFRPQGALEHFEESAPGGFRAFFFGVVRNVARSFEARHRRGAPPPIVEDDEAIADGAAETPSRAFDAAWARALLREAADRQAARAMLLGEAARRRVDLLRRRFDEGLGIAEIARRYGGDPAVLHHEFAKAKTEFQAALHDVLLSHHGGDEERARRALVSLRDDFAGIL